MARRRVTYLAARVAFITDSYASTRSAPVRVAGRPTGHAYLAGRGRVDAGESGVEKPERHDAVPAAGPQPSGLLHQAMAVGANTFGTSHAAHVTVEGGGPKNRVRVSEQRCEEVQRRLHSKRNGRTRYKATHERLRDPSYTRRYSLYAAIRGCDHPQ